MNFQHTQLFEVRDYECDLQGIVNNANYQHYLEHARHKFLNTLNLDFAALSAQGIDLVVIRIEIDYLYPLRSGDAFEVHTNLARLSPLRFAFHQHIFRTPDEKPIAKALVVGTSINKQGRPVRAKAVDEALATHPTL